MKLCMKDSDTICMENGNIQLVLDGQNYSFTVDQIQEAVIITTDMGPVYDDMCLAMKIDEQTAIFIMSAHPQYENFLFKQLGKTVTVDYEKITEAACCIERQVFLIYKKQ